MRTCSVKECNKTVLAKELCSTHYRRFLRTGTTDKSSVENKGNICSVEGCNKESKNSGLCYQHHHKKRAYNNPIAGNSNVINANQECLVSDCNNPSTSKLLCRKHYHNFVYHKKKNNCKDVNEYLALKNNQTK